MIILKTPFSSKKKILALGPESEGVFAFYKNGTILISENFGDLIKESDFLKYKKEIKKLLKKERPDIILTDSHPFYNSTLYGEKLAKKLKFPMVKIQHHLAHIFSAFGEKIIKNGKIPKKAKFLGLACDGTGYGTDGKIWGGEIFKFQIKNRKLKTARIGHLENQTLIGGDLAIKEPARMLIAILTKFLNKKEIYKYVKKYYSKNEFELLHNQLRQNFHCQETSSAARILDAASLLLGFCPNRRELKHQPAFLLEKNSELPSFGPKPKIFLDKEGKYRLLTVPLFEYLIKNIKKDKKKLAGAVQIYLAKGFWEILKKEKTDKKIPVFFAGGISNNKIIAGYLEKKGIIMNSIIPRGDAGLSFGQIIYYLSLADSGD